MKKDITMFESYAKKLIELALDPAGRDRVFEELGNRQPKVKKLERGRFFEEYIPAKLALGCGYWAGCCGIHRIKDKEIRNVFFKEVMKRFETPNSLAIATRFSECLYAANVNPDESPALAIMGLLFDRLKIDRLDRGAGGNRVSSGFLFMMEICDALKSVFESEFDDFIYADGHFRVY